MKTSIQELKQNLSIAAQSFISKDEAEYFAELVVETHIKKYPRMDPINEALADLQIWRDQADHQITNLIEKPGVSLVDFNKLAPSLKVKHLHDDLEKRARTNGVAATGIRNSSGITTLSMWTDGLAKRDMIGIVMFNGGTECGVPYGGRRGVFGTNPMAYSIPTLDQPIALDMATTEIPYFEIKEATEQDKPLRKNVAVDAFGCPTTNAAEALDDQGRANLLPIGGGFKGYGIMLLIEVLTGTLIQSMLSTEQTSGWNPTEYGALILAIDISGLTDLVTFKSRVSEMSQTIRNETPADGFGTISVPGDRGHQKLVRAIKEKKVDVTESTMHKLSIFVGS